MFYSGDRTIKKFFLFIFVFLGLGCSGAPTIIGFTIEPDSIREGERVININGLFREGYYCGTIKLIDPSAQISWEMSDLKKYKIPENIDIKYEITIPATGYKHEGVFLSSSGSYLVEAYNERLSYQEFNISVENIPDYRAKTFIKITYLGDESQLSHLSFGVSVSEWECK